LIEILSCLNFIIFIDKKSLEFLVINKDSKTDKLGLKNKIKKDKEVDITIDNKYKKLDDEN